VLKVSLKDSMAGKRRGVLQPLVVKSIRISRVESLVKGSRQKGQAGETRGEVFSTMVAQQLAHRTCPIQKRKKKLMRKNSNEMRKKKVPQGMECGGRCGPYSSAHTSQEHPGARVSIRPAS